MARGLEPGVTGGQRVLAVMGHRTYRAAPFVDAAARLGLAFTVANEREQVLARERPADFLILDFADVPGSAAAIARHAARYPVSGIVAADDDGVALAAAACEALELPGHPPGAVALCRDKLAMRRALAAAGRPGPRFAELPLGADPGPAGRVTGFPCVVKPRALSASRGVVRADDGPALARAAESLTRYLARPEVRRESGGAAGSILVESYLPGREVAVEGLVSDGRLDVLAIFDKPDPMEGPLFEETVYVTPSSLDTGQQARVADEAAAATRALGLTDGAAHVELRVDGKRAAVLEVAPRSIGGLCSAALSFVPPAGESRLAGSASLEELILLRALGARLDGVRREGAASGVMMIPVPGRGVLRGVAGLDAARDVPGVTGVRITIPVGHPVVPLPEGDRYLGFIFARGEAARSVETALRAAHRALRFEIGGP